MLVVVGKLTKQFKNGCQNKRHFFGRKILDLGGFFLLTKGDQRHHILM